MNDYTKIIENLIPVFILAGDYALVAQNRVDAKATPMEGTIFSRTSTVADTSIQTFFEVALLAQLPETSFYGEEHSDAPNNQKLFANDSSMLTTLDPLNHNLAYIDGRPSFDIILTISVEKQIQAAVVYLPAIGEFYIGIADRGAYFVSRQNSQSTSAWQKRTITDTQSPFLLYNDSVTASRIKNIDTIDLVNDYTPKGSWDITISSILRGELSGFYRTNAPVIDWGAVGFIAQLAGAVVSDTSGNPIANYFDSPDFRIPSLVVSCSQRIHAEVLEAI